MKIGIKGREKKGILFKVSNCACAICAYAYTAEYTARHICMQTAGYYAAKRAKAEALTG